jgi:hypothetical protein
MMTSKALIIILFNWFIFGVAINFIFVILRIRTEIIFTVLALSILSLIWISYKRIILAFIGI